jgi:hypothetical protein
MVMFEEKGVKFTVLALDYQAHWWCWTCSCHIHGEKMVMFEKKGVKFTVLALGYLVHWWCWACSCHIHGAERVRHLHNHSVSAVYGAHLIELRVVDCHAGLLKQMQSAPGCWPRLAVRYHSSPSFVHVTWYPFCSCVLLCVCVLQGC